MSNIPTCVLLAWKAHPGASTLPGPSEKLGGQNSLSSKSARQAIRSPCMFYHPFLHVGSKQDWSWFPLLLYFKDLMGLRHSGYLIMPFSSGL